MRTLSLIVGWFHLIIAILLSISLLIYLCSYNNKTYEDTVLEGKSVCSIKNLHVIKKILKIISEKVSNAGLPTLVFLLIFSVASVIFDILLLKGISQVW